MERVKDFLYDISDLFFSLLIIGIIFFVVSWKLTDTMAVTWFSNINSDTKTELDFADVTTPDEPILIVEEPIVEPETPLVEEPVVEEPILEVRDIDFTISRGDTGYRIGVKLVDEGLVTDVDTFLKELADLEMGNQLQADTFTLNTGMSLEEIILTLARRN